MSWLSEIKEFSSYSEFKEFVQYLSERLSEKELIEVEPEEFYHGFNEFGLNEDRWFLDCSSDDVWRLVPPDFPFKGFFEKVKKPLSGYRGE